jgi:hypothetical protein
MIDLRIFEFNHDYYLFSDDFKPGKSRRSEKQFRDYWLKLRDKLKFPASYKINSFKDTGITDLLGKPMNPLLVRDQARNSTIDITDIYTPNINKNDRKEITDLESSW